ncbi:MAG: ubiquinone biosynthesis regulatory protein kinase UbiB [Gammaproteobacteria bacterium]
MTSLPGLLRLWWVLFVLARAGGDEIILGHPRLPGGRLLLRLLPWRWRARPPRGVRLREALEKLGPIFVKFGQILSTRRDLLPPDIADELVRLQDQVPPFPGEQARRLIEAAYGQPLTTVLAEFDDVPLASASIAQVHAGRLPDGREIVIKVVRPGIAPRIRRDIRLLYMLARFAHRVVRETRRLRPVEVVREFELTLLDELDLMREAGNASQLRRHWLDSPDLYVPEVYWDYVRPNVMMMERIRGIGIDNIAAMHVAGVDFQRLAERGVEIFFRQVFEHNFFHADMHAGNIFVGPNEQYIAVDFGIVGSLRPQDQRYLAENFVAFFNRDYATVAKAHLRAGWVPADMRVDQFEGAIRAVCEPIFDKPLKDISFGILLLRLFQVARRFDMQVQPQLVLLQKTLLNIEGLGRRLYPELDLWRTAKPFLERWMAERIGWRALRNTLREEAPLWAETLPRLPNLVYGALEQAQRPQMLPPAPRRRWPGRLELVLGGAGLTAAAGWVWQLAGFAQPVWLGIPALAWPLGLLTIVLLWPRRG